MNAREVAKLLDMHPNTIYNMIRNGVIKAEKDGRSYDIPQDELKTLAAQKYGSDMNAQNERSAYTLINEYTSQSQLELRNILIACRLFVSIIEEEGFDELDLLEQSAKLIDIYNRDLLSFLFESVRKRDKFQKIILELQELAKKLERRNSIEKIQDEYKNIDELDRLLHRSSEEGVTEKLEEVMKKLR